MTDDPCQQLYQEYLAAMQEWVSACSAAQSYVVTKPISLHEDITPLTVQQTKQMMEAYDREQTARTAYFDKMSAYMECRKRYRK